MKKGLLAIFLIGLLSISSSACQEEEVVPEKTLSGITQDDKAWD